MMRVEFTIPSVTPSLNTWQRMNRYQKPKVRRMFAWECRAFRPVSWPVTPPPFVRVSITRCGKKLLDADNLTGGVKPCLDALKDAGFIADDSPAHIALDVAQVLTKAQPHMRIRLEIDHPSSPAFDRYLHRVASGQTAG